MGSFPAVGSHVVLESRRPYLSPEVWEGIVVRHARTQNAIAVEMINGTVRLVTPGTKECRIVEVAARPAVPWRQ